MRSLSNLIKSGKVVDLGVPVNVGISYEFNNLTKKVIENKKTLTDIKNENNFKPSNQPQKNIPTEEEIMEKYVLEAKKKAELEYNAVLEKAYEEGMAKANEEAKDIIENANLEYQNILDEIVKLKEETILQYKNEIKGLEKDVLGLALDIAEKVINYEINRSDDYVLGIVKDAMEKVMSKKDAVLKLSTADYYTILTNKKHLVANVKGFGEIEIIQDESLEPGTCIVDTPLGVIDGSLQVRMDNIQKEVKRMLSE